jgi:hypothetical protein
MFFAPKVMISTDNIPAIDSSIVPVNDPNDRLVISGRLLRIARPRSETFAPLDHPELFLDRLREGRARADLFSFAQRFSEPEPRYKHFYELEPAAILEIQSYEKWWKETVNDKTRNMVRKAGKKGVQVEVAAYTDDLVRGIKQIYDECPIRQGKKSRHYGKSFDVIKREHATFLDSSEFIAAMAGDRLVGFAKVVFQRDFASIMNIIALISERDKAPNNALLAKIVERCATKGIKLLHYGVWGHRGFAEFKIHQGFRSRLIPRYYVPLTSKGALALQLGLHRPLVSRIPERHLDRLAMMRLKWYSIRYPMK